MSDFMNQGLCAGGRVNLNGSLQASALNLARLFFLEDNDVVTDCEPGQLTVALGILLQAFPLRRLRKLLAVLSTTG